jgi:hypothetical protein
VHGVVDKVGGLNSITKPFSDDLMDNRLFVPRRKLKRMAFFAIFLVLIHFLLNAFLPFSFLIKAFPASDLVQNRSREVQH